MDKGVKCVNETNEINIARDEPNRRYLRPSVAKCNHLEGYKYENV